MLPVSPGLGDSGMHTPWDRSQQWPSCAILCRATYGDHTASEDPAAPMDLGV